MITKSEFANLIENSLLECKNLYDDAKKAAENTFDSLVTKTNAIESIELNGDYKYNVYMQKYVMSKLNQLYKKLSKVARNRINSSSNEEIENYRKEKISVIEEKIKKDLLNFEKETSHNNQIKHKDYIDSLLSEQQHIKEMKQEDLIKNILNILSTEEDDLEPVNYDTSENERNIIKNITKDEQTMTKFYSLIREYRKNKSYLSSLELEEKIIFNDVLPDNDDKTNLLGEDSEDRLRESLRKFISNDDDVDNEFSDKIKEAYYSLISKEYKLNIKNDIIILPYNTKDLKLMGDKIDPQIFEKAELQNLEWKRLNSKTFKTLEVKTRILQLNAEIEYLKDYIDKQIRDYYKKKFVDSDKYKTISTRINGKLEYSLGAAEYLKDFITMGMWPSKEKIELVKKTRELNQKELETKIIRIQKAKEKFGYKYIIKKDKINNKILEIEKELNDLVGDFKNPTIMSIINNTRIYPTTIKEEKNNKKFNIEIEDKEPKKQDKIKFIEDVLETDEIPT